MVIKCNTLNWNLARFLKYPKCQNFIPTEAIIVIFKNKMKNMVGNHHFGWPATYKSPWGVAQHPNGMVFLGCPTATWPLNCQKDLWLTTPNHRGDCYQSNCNGWMRPPPIAIGTYGGMPYHPVAIVVDRIGCSKGVAILSFSAPSSVKQAHSKLCPGTLD